MGDLVTVIISVYNGERFISDAVASVLAQDGIDLECIVVDDGSTDLTPEIARGFADDRVRVIHQENRGVSAARNVGLAQARGEYVAFLDADDVWRPGKLGRQLELFRRDPALAIALTGYALGDHELRVREVVRDAPLVPWMLLEGNGQLLSSTGMVRRAAAAPELRFDEELSTSADLDFAWRLTRCGTSATVPEPLVVYRQHDSQMHTDFALLERDVLRLYATHFDESRADERALARRGKANLYTRATFAALAGGRLRPAARYLRTVLGLRARQLVLLPLG
ncbi:MAG: glycosyl transferase, partial [Solirubrobacterales bacterium]|nr:glycosyl transferase [Solirubrobacterales bacterium]